jgi:L-threonylcarbamoyladenylate synthase
MKNTMVDAAIEQAVRVLRSGGLVAFPTETVYGLGADASDAQAVRKIFAAKGRPADHPVIVHLASADQVSEWAIDVPEAAYTLAQRFWPGPLTLILRRARQVPDAVTGGQDTVGIRVPSHPIAHAMLEAFGSGVAGPSANRFGRISATTAQHVRDELGDKADFVLDGGPCSVGIESTIVDVSKSSPVMLRPGRIMAQEIESVLQQPLGRLTHASPRAAGTLAAHYAPRLPLRVVSAGLLDAAVREASKHGPVAVLSRHSRPGHSDASLWMMAPMNAAEYARLLYAGLRQLDDSGCIAIIIEALPETPDWAAVRDRITRAAAGSGHAGSSAT